MSASPAHLVLSRHGQTTWHAENRYAGTSDVDLTEVGHRQADALARWAGGADLQALYCSPVRRARLTAEPVSAALGRPAEIVDDLAEVHFGMAEGLTIAEVREQDPQVAAAFLADPVRHPFPGAEPVEAAAARGAGALRRIAANHPGQRVLIVAHNTLLRLSLCVLLGIPLSHYRRVLPRMDNGTLTDIDLAGGDDDLAALRSFNVPLEAVGGPDLVPTPAPRSGAVSGRHPSQSVSPDGGIPS